MNGPSLPATLISTVGARLIRVSAGDFLMGSSETENGHRPSEPLRPVTLTHDYYLGQTAVTQEQYATVAGTNPSYCPEAGPSAPVECVNRSKAMEFCEQLTLRDRDAAVLPANWEYRLPAEAEWEFACRAGSQTPWYGPPDDIAWFFDNSQGQPHPVCRKQPNAWGFHDMLGNVWELCDDIIHEGQSLHAVRGGSFFNSALSCRSASRHCYNGGRYVGFRLMAGPVDISCSPASARFSIDRLPPRKISRGIYDAIDADDPAAASNVLAEDKSQLEAVDLIPPPLHYAIYHNKPRFVQILLDHGAAIERRDPDFAATPLSYSVVHQRHKIIRMLVERGAQTENMVRLAERGRDGEFEVYEDLLPSTTYQATIDLLKELGVES